MDPQDQAGRQDPVAGWSARGAPPGSGTPSGPRTRKVAGTPDEDAELVARVRGGDDDAFEELIARHGAKVYRAVIGITGDPADAEDATQNAFIKAHTRLDTFQGTARFSTWLTRIAINEGLEVLRRRRPHETLDDAVPEANEDFHPANVRPWADDPETLYSQAEIRELVEKAIMKLPAKYRVVAVLRDLDGLSTEEAATALGLQVPALKTRLLRARLMLREALAPHFQRRTREGGRAHL
ncbi:MAG: sigma-70 family RNA polymerase sigma factor [Candidatus Polarisedimenticolia bacterium]